MEIDAERAKEEPDARKRGPNRAEKKQKREATEEPSRSEKKQKREATEKEQKVTTEASETVAVKPNVAKAKPKVKFEGVKPKEEDPQAAPRKAQKRSHTREASSSSQGPRSMWEEMHAAGRAMFLSDEEAD